MCSFTFVIEHFDNHAFSPSHSKCSRIKDAEEFSKN